MKPIPVAFHIGPLEIHTYGIGLALTFWFAYGYFSGACANAGTRPTGSAGMFIWVIVTAVVGARALHVLSNLSFYDANPGDVFAIWHGGLSSFGGILFAVPTGIWQTHRRCPDLRVIEALDLVAPVLMAAWAMGRLLGPQLMVAGGGTRPTSGSACTTPARPASGSLCRSSRPWRTSRSSACSSRWNAAFAVARRHPAGRLPRRGVIGVGMVLWGIERFLDEHLWLRRGRPPRVAARAGGRDRARRRGVALVVVTRRRWTAWLGAGAPGGRPGRRRADSGRLHGIGGTGRAEPRRGRLALDGRGGPRDGRRHQRRPPLPTRAGQLVGRQQERLVGNRIDQCPLDHVVTRTQRRTCAAAP